MADAQVVDLSVATPLGLALTAKAESVTAPSVNGELTVLPGHLPLLAALRSGLLRIRAGHEETVAAVGPGFLEIGAERVLVLCERLARKADVDVGEARKDLEQAQRELVAFGELNEGAAFEEKQRALDWAQARLDLVDATK